MLEIDFLLDLAIILLSTKLLGLITKKIHMPQVVGALLAGIILGPSILGIIHESDFIDKMSQLGVILLMFGAGMETDLKELKKCGKASLIIAILGVVVPLLGGFAVASIFNGGSIIGLDSKTLLQNIVMGVVLTATSVSITVETLQELGKLNTASGTAILGAAVIDDIIGIILLTLVTGVSGDGVNISLVLLKIALFFILSLILGFAAYHVFNILGKREGRKRRIALSAFVFCLVMAFAAEHFFGVASIIGAYVAGIVISNTCQSHYIMEKTDVVSFMLLSPIFFASIGIKTNLEGIDGGMIGFIAAFVAVAIISKIVGCGLGARACGYTKSESLRIGAGMVSRGEVGLIVANMGVSMGLMDNRYFAPVIIVVIITSLITPILLKIAYSQVGEVSRKRVVRGSMV